MPPITESVLYQTIYRQPADWRALIARDPAELAAAAEKLGAAGRILLVGIGTSHHAAEIGAFLFRAAGRDAWAVHSPDFASYPIPFTRDDAVVVISHRGTKKFSAQSLQVARDKGAWTLAISGQDAAMPADQVLHTVAQERSATFTASYTGALLTLALLAGRLGAPGIGDALDALPGQAEQTLTNDAQVREWAQQRSAASRFIFAGGGIASWTAREGALKTKEASYVTAEGMSLEALLHGALTGLHLGDQLLIVNVRGAFEQRASEMAAAGREVGLEVTWVGNPLDQPSGLPGFAVPTTSELLAPLLTVIPLQLVACYLAEAQSANPDSFRMHVPEYDRAFKSVKL